MPLHDWNNRGGWDGVHHVWITELLRNIKPQLPPGLRAYIGTAPALTIGASLEKPDVSVREWTQDAALPSTNGPAGKPAEAPDEEIAVATLEPASGVYVALENRLIAAVELVSPRNKDRPASRDAYLARYLGYLLEGVHLLLVDVHRRPLGFSFPGRLAQEMSIQQPELPAPNAVSYRVGEAAAAGGRMLAIWRRTLTVGSPLPSVPLALSVETAVSVDLEKTYQRAAEDAYL
ncbi:MAG: DUF4058 family protein [Gemmataceae bacterium]